MICRNKDLDQRSTDGEARQDREGKDLDQRDTDSKAPQHL
jgi:hypothetical protein